MVMMSCEQQPPSMLQSQEKAHTILMEFTETTMSNYNTDPDLAQLLSERLSGQMEDIPELGM